MEQNKQNKNYLNISKINNFVYIGSFDHAFTDSEEFQKLGINVIINCTKEIEHPSEIIDKYTVINFPFENNDSASLLEYIDEVNEKIHNYLENGKKIYLHCIKGISRAPAILIYYLMSHKKFSYDQAHDLIREIRPVININDNFERELRIIEDN